MRHAATERSRLNVPALVGLVALPVCVGLLSSALTMGEMEQFDLLRKPPLAPPGWLFPVAWTVLYVAMGLASYLLYAVRPADGGARRTRRAALVVYGIQLVLNFVWSIVFFGLGQRWVAFGILMAMWVLVLVLTVLAFKLRTAAGWCLVPYVLWTTFAAYLNLMTALLN